MRAVHEAGAIHEAGAVQRARSVCSDPVCYLENMDAPSGDELHPGSGVTVV